MQSLFNPTNLSSSLSLVVEDLNRIVNLIALNQNQLAQIELNGFLEKLNQDCHSNAIIFQIFASALYQRLSPSNLQEKNLYLKKYDVPQIHLFNLLAHHFPPVYLASHLANSLILNACEGKQEITIIDVGIGTGRQMVDLLNIISEQDSPPKHILVIGIDPSLDSLQLAEKNLQATAAEKSLSLTFVAIAQAVEHFAQEDWNLLRKFGANSIINASFALHHIEDIDGQDVRNSVLQRFSYLNPLALVLSEPNVNHLEKDFCKRFHNCWSFIEVLFRMTDALNLTIEDKIAIKKGFFEREIVDIVANSEEVRTERHEMIDSWLARLQASGFKPNTELKLPSLPTASVMEVNVQSHYFSLDFEGETLVTILSAAPQ